ncbi:hypothetical protein [Pedobacter sp. SYSU D00535]|uniref:hypothetical protein n=1 Tax=Pedobacter sp. SYSU D00535 TaxID=2810308 RepID=UPI001A95D280|nr:hypothetical protein [Pedobacter sp. SYSU D00535]
MSELKADHPLALQLLMSDDLYYVDEIEISRPPESLAQPEEKPVEQEFTGFEYLGENNKYFVLVVDEPGHKFMAPKEMEALQSILGAKKLELKDIALVNLHKYPGSSFSQLKSFFALSKLVIFGINPQHLQLPPLTLNKVTDMDGAKVLVSYSFTEMMNDVEKKKAFWAEMKGM